jgi:hypothetical protein
MRKTDNCGRETMNATIRAYGAENGEKATLPVKTFDLWLTVTDRHFEKKIMRAFEMAKTAGRELDVTFSPKTS